MTSLYESVRVPKSVSYVPVWEGIEASSHRHDKYFDRKKEIYYDMWELESSAFFRKRVIWDPVSGAARRRF